MFVFAYCDSLDPCVEFSTVSSYSVVFNHRYSLSCQFANLDSSIMMGDFVFEKSYARKSFEVTLSHTCCASTFPVRFAFD